MDIQVLGVGEASDPDYANAAVAVAADGFRVLIDCGHSVPPPLWRALPEPNAIDAVYFTHTHPDHCFGFVPALIRWHDDRRSKPLTVVAAPDSRRVLTLLMEAVDMDPADSLLFRLDWRETPADGELGPFRIRTAPTMHARPNRAIRFEAGGRSFAYSGDGRPTTAAEDLYRGADLLFHECYAADALPDQPYHASLPLLAELPDRLGIGQMRLYHVRIGGRSELAGRCDGKRVALAQAGETYTL